MDITDYKQFMRIESFPHFEEEYFEYDDSQEFGIAGRAEYDQLTKAHKLLLPSNYEVPRFLLFHELTHILDMENLANGEKNHDFCLTGYMEYHASQVELMEAVGAKTIRDTVSFSMKDRFIASKWMIQQYVDNKLETAKTLISKSDKHKKVIGLETFFNFLGLKSICAMYATDYVEYYSYRELENQMPSYLLYEIN